MNDVLFNLEFSFRDRDRKEKIVSIELFGDFFYEIKRGAKKAIRLGYPVAYRIRVGDFIEFKHKYYGTTAAEEILRSKSSLEDREYKNSNKTGWERMVVCVTHIDERCIDEKTRRGLARDSGCVVSFRIPGDPIPEGGPS
jgi:ASC-1-like (ASCH) protein